MNKLFLFNLVVLLSFSFQLKGQDQVNDNQYDTTPFTITKCIDTISERETYIGSKGILCIDRDKPVDNDTKAFNVRVNFDKNKKTGNVRYSGITVVSVGIGNCVEASTLDFVMESGNKVKMIAWNKFNCDGQSYMDWVAWTGGKNANALWDLISTEKVKMIRFTNGREGQYFTYNLTEEESSYFIEAREALTKTIPVVDCTK
jgi:hypothetical protein